MEILYSYHLGLAEGGVRATDVNPRARKGSIPFLVSGNMAAAVVVVLVGCNGGETAGRVGDVVSCECGEVDGFHTDGSSDGDGSREARGADAWETELLADADVSGSPDRSPREHDQGDTREYREDLVEEQVPADVPPERAPDEELVPPADGDAAEEPGAPPDSMAFEVPVNDPLGHTLHGTIWSPRGGPSPLVLLVHGLGCTHDIWGPVHFDLIETLRAAGFTVAAYDQRGHGRSRHLEFRLAEMAKDIGRVIAYLDQEYGVKTPWIDTARPVGLLGHSLGAYMVTIAACRNLDYLGLQSDRIGVVVAGAGPDNLPELKEWLDVHQSFDYLISLMVAALWVFQPEDDWSPWWSSWAETGFGAYDELTTEVYMAQNPIGYGHGDGVATLDNVDFLSVPYYVAHSLSDTLVPAIPPISAPSHLYNDVTYDVGPLGLWTQVNPSTGYHTYSLIGHDIWMDKDVVDWAVRRLQEHLL